MKKFVTWLLVCLMVVSALPMAAFAESAAAVCPGEGQPHNASNCTSALLKEVKATCEKSGYVLNACTTCATPFVVSTSEKLVCVEDTIDAVDGTCGTKEIVGKTYCTTCTVEDCDVCVNVTVPAATQKDARDAHRGSWKLISTYDDCTKGQTYYCRVCDETFSVRGADYADHKWKLVAVTVEPTCTDKGRALLACIAKNCNAEKTVEVAALGHDMDYTVPAIEGKPATCTKTGTKDIYGCSRCDRQLVIVGNKYVAMTDENKIIPMAHDFGEGTVSANNPEGWALVRNYVPGDCTTDETIEAYCQFCNKYISVVLTEAPGHNWGTGVAGSETCVGTYKVYTCACGETKTEWDTADKAMPTTKTHQFGTYAAASAAGSGVAIRFNKYNCVTDKIATWTCACGDTMTETVATAPGHIVATQTVQSTNCMIPTYTFEYCNSGVDCGMHTYTDDVAKVIDGKLTFVGTWTDPEDADIKYVTDDEPDYVDTHPQLVVQVGENVEFIRIVSVSMDEDGKPVCADNHNWTKTYNTTTVGLPAVDGLGEATCTAEGHYVNICVKHAIMEKDAGGNPLIGTDSVKPHNWTDAGLVPGSAQAATCTVNGTKATYKCADCPALAIKEGTTFVAKTDANVVIPKTNHNMVNLVVKNDALCNTAIATWDATAGAWVATTGYDYTIQVCTNAHCSETNSTIGGLKAVSYATGTTAPVIPDSSETLAYVNAAYATVTLGNKACGDIAVYGSIVKAAAEHAVPATAAGWTEMSTSVILCEAPLIYTINCTGCGVNVMVEDASQVGKHVNDGDYADEGEVAPSDVDCNAEGTAVPEYGKFACQFCGELFDNDPATATVKVNHDTITITEANTQFVSCDTDVWSKVGTLCLRCGMWDGEGDAAVKTYEGVGHDIVHHEAVPAQCGIDGVKAYDTCSRCDYESLSAADRKVEALRHIPVRVNDLSAEKAADCTVTGGTYYRCGLCNGKLAGGHKVVVTADDLAKAHDFTVLDSVAAGCTTDGKTFNKCANCAVIDETSVEILPATGHTDATGKFFSDCDTGYTGGRTCTVCNIEIDVTHGDNLVEHSVDATCTEPGVKYTYCTYCEIYVEGPIVDVADGEHTWVRELESETADADGWFVTVEPTATENGVKIRQCERCGYTETGVVYAPVQYSVVVDNYIVPGATIVENSIVAVTVVLNKTIASVWGFELDLIVPDGNNFEYLGVEDVNANFTIQVADHGEKISMFAYNITGVENIAVESDVELVTLLFRVVAPRTTTGATALNYENAYKFSIDEDILTLDAEGEKIASIVSDPAEVEIGKLLCMDDEDALTINDLRVAFLLIQDGEYASEFDIDLDGALTLSDISTIQALILVADAQFNAEVAKLLKAAW